MDETIKLARLNSMNWANHLHFNVLSTMRNVHRNLRPFQHVFLVVLNGLKALFYFVVNSDWNNIDSDNRISTLHDIFRNAFLKCNRPVEKKTYSNCDSAGPKLLPRLQLGLCHLRKHKCRHGFKSNLNDLCSCSAEAGTTTNYIFNCCFGCLSLMMMMMMMISLMMKTKKNELFAVHPKFT